ncbi:MAG: DNA alkylation repair protein [Paraprevotella sp.]|nr:DNA alkylation repair protein [Paraprevotella sp.]
MDIQATIREIKKELRLAMNGIASSYMRENGLQYKLNFGVELPRLRTIAQEFPASHELAQALWKENIRECKLLAGMLQPTDSFLPEIADIWAESITTVEIAQHTTQNLFCRLPYASEKAYEWIAREEEMLQICGYLILARLFMQGLQPNERAENEFLDQARAALFSGAAIQKAVISALQKYQSLNEQTFAKGEIVLKEIEQ